MEEYDKVKDLDGGSDELSSWEDNDLENWLDEEDRIEEAIDDSSELVKILLPLQLLKLEVSEGDDDTESSEALENSDLLVLAEGNPGSERVTEPDDVPVPEELYVGE